MSYIYNLRTAKRLIRDQLTRSDYLKKSSGAECLYYLTVSTFLIFHIDSRFAFFIFWTYNAYALAYHHHQDNDDLNLTKPI